MGPAPSPADSNSIGCRRCCPVRLGDRGPQRAAPLPSRHTRRHRCGVSAFGLLVHGEGRASRGRAGGARAGRPSWRRVQTACQTPSDDRVLARAGGARHRATVHGQPIPPGCRRCRCSRRHWRRPRVSMSVPHVWPFKRPTVPAGAHDVEVLLADRAVGHDVAASCPAARSGCGWARSLGALKPCRPCATRSDVRADRVARVIRLPSRSAAASMTRRIWSWPATSGWTITRSVVRARPAYSGRRLRRPRHPRPAAA